jgi:S-adenosylmethionine decarboxylase proenzyme
LQLTADLSGCRCEAALLQDTAALRALCQRVVAAAGLRAVGEAFHGFAPAGAGVTGVVLLAESHLAVHTWPELEAVTLDVYVCNHGADNSPRARQLMALLLEAFHPSVMEQHQLDRGGRPCSAVAAAAPASVPSVNASSKTE